MMPVSPKDCEIYRKSNTRDEFDFWCNKIDENLRKACGREHWFNIRNIDCSVLDQIKLAYEKAGWDVFMILDSRDGDALVLKEKK